MQFESIHNVLRMLYFVLLLVAVTSLFLIPVLG